MTRAREEDEEKPLYMYTRERKTERERERERGFRFAPHRRLNESHISLRKHEPMYLSPSSCSSSAISWKGPSNELDVHLGALKRRPVTSRVPPPPRISNSAAHGRGHSSTTTRRPARVHAPTCASRGPRRDIYYPRTGVTQYFNKAYAATIRN